jgi:hypothetical protein
MKPGGSDLTVLAQAVRHLCNYVLKICKMNKCFSCIILAWFNGFICILGHIRLPLCLSLSDSRTVSDMLCCMDLCHKNRISLLKLANDQFFHGIC